MGNPNQSNTNEEPMLTLPQELILRYKQRIRMVWKEPSPFIKPLWEISELNIKIKELQKIKK